MAHNEKLDETSSENAVISEMLSRFNLFKQFSGYRREHWWTEVRNLKAIQG